MNSVPYKPISFGWRPGYVNPRKAASLSGIGALGDVVPDGSVITYQGSWPTGFLESANSLIQAVEADLAGSGVSVISVNSNSLLNQIESAVAWTPVSVTMQLLVSNGGAGIDTDSLVALIDDAVYAATGSAANGAVTGWTTPATASTAAQTVTTTSAAALNSPAAGNQALSFIENNFATIALIGIGTYLAVKLL